MRVLFLLGHNICHAYQVNIKRQRIRTVDLKLCKFTSSLNLNQNVLLFLRHLGSSVLHQLEPKTVTMMTEMVALGKNHLFPTAAAVAVTLTQ